MTVRFDAAANHLRPSPETKELPITFAIATAYRILPDGSHVVIGMAVRQADGTYQIIEPTPKEG